MKELWYAQLKNQLQQGLSHCEINCSRHCRLKQNVILSCSSQEKLSG